MLNDEHQIRAISNIKAGKEINITYNSDPLSGLRNKEFRQMSLLLKWFFMCSCDLCKNGVDIDTNKSESHTFPETRLRAVVNKILKLPTIMQ